MSGCKRQEGWKMLKRFKLSANWGGHYKLGFIKSWNFWLKFLIKPLLLTLPPLYTLLDELFFFNIDNWESHMRTPSFLVNIDITLHMFGFFSAQAQVWWAKFTFTLALPYLTKSCLKCYLGSVQLFGKGHGFVLHASVAYKKKRLYPTPHWWWKLN